METIFENAKFGDKFRTRDGRLAIYNYHSIGGYHDIIVDEEGASYHYSDHCNGIIRLPKNPDPNVDYSSPIDIVSEWEEPVNNEKLVESATRECGLIVGTVGEITMSHVLQAYKAGYRKAKSE